MTDNKPAAIAATFVDFKNVKTRGVLQLIFEIPIHGAKDALDMLDMPDAGKERWFGIAALAKEVKAVESQPVLDKPQAGTQFGKRERRDWRDMQPAQQAGIRCDEPAFCAFLRTEYNTEWREGYVEAATDSGNAAECVRLICGVASRSELGTNQKARVIWHQLDDQYQAWLRVGA